MNLYLATLGSEENSNREKSANSEIVDTYGSLMHNFGRGSTSSSTSSSTCNAQTSLSSYFAPGRAGA